MAVEVQKLFGRRSRPESLSPSSMHSPSSPHGELGRRFQVDRLRPFAPSFVLIPCNLFSSRVLPGLLHLRSFVLLLVQPLTSTAICLPSLQHSHSPFWTVSPLSLEQQKREHSRSLRWNTMLHPKNSVANVSNLGNNEEQALLRWRDHCRADIDWYRPFL